MIRRFDIVAEAKVQWLSRGQRAGVSIASALAHDPELLILDAPALGLDPVSRRALNETIVDFCESGTRSVLLSSHLLDEVERIADRVAIMIDGTLQVDTPLDNFCERVTAWIIDAHPLPQAILTLPGLIHARPIGDRWHLTIAGSDGSLADRLNELSQHRATVTDVSFEDAVLAYLSRSRVGHSFLVGDAA